MGDGMKSIETRYLGPTDTRGGRILATDHDGHRITVPYDHALNPDAMHRAAAYALCRKLGWHGTYYQGSNQRGYAFVCKDDDAYFIA